MARLTPEQLVQVLALKASGNVIAAIKEVREATGMGLAEAKGFVEALPDRDGVAMAQAATPRVPDALFPGTPLDATQQQTVRELLANGQKIQAIKHVRDWTGLGLREAKDLVEAWQGRPAREAGSADEPRRAVTLPRLVLLAAALVAVAAIVAWVSGR